MSGVRLVVRSIGVGVVLLALLGVAACGEDEDDAGGDAAAFCDAYLEMVQSSDSDEELKNLGEKAETLLADVEANTPNEISEPVGVVVDATRQAAADGTPDAFQSAEVSDAFSAVISYLFDNCEFDEKLDVTAVEYAFEGVPDTVAAGLVALRFSNDGDESHEFIVFRKHDGVTESFDEIFELPEGQRAEFMTFVASGNILLPGESSETVFEGEEGEHIAVCFIPVGSTGEEPAGEPGPAGEGDGPPPEGPAGEPGPAGEGDGPPHFAEGQRSEFTVE